MLRTSFFVIEMIEMADPEFLEQSRIFGGALSVGFFQMQVPGSPKKWDCRCFSESHWLTGRGTNLKIKQVDEDTQPGYD